jgi:hypothetical protein
MRPIAALVVLLALGRGLGDAAEPAKRDVAPKSEYETVSLRGKIVWLAEALARRYDVAVDPDAGKYDIALEGRDGQLTPIVKDFRGRAFHLDPKLHEFDWELLVRRFPGSPFVQVVRTYVWRDGKKYEFDYWCDICAIPMYELKECECCQGPIRFRFREVHD